MALLESDEEDFEVRRANTNDQLFDDSHSEFKLKEKRERKVKSDERKGSLKSLPWTKPKDGLQEKTPKKSKHNRTKSGSRTPPDSPKVSRPIDSRRAGKVATGQLVPSPNVKGNRKRYSQLGDASESSEEDETEGGYLLSNRPVLDEHKHQPIANRGALDSEVSFHNPPVLSSTAAFTNIPGPSSPLRKTTNPSFFDSPFLSDDPWMSSGGSVLQPEPVDGTPKKLQPSEISSRQQMFQPLEDSIAQREDKTVHSSTTDTFFASPMPSHTTKPAMVNPWATSEAPTDWSISDELKQKCSKHFLSLKPTNGLLQGDKAREFFVQSKLPNQELSQIWRLADMDRDNALSMEEFCVAMKLVLMRRKGHDIPSTLPSHLQQLHNKDSFSDSFWPEPLQLDTDDVIGESPHSDEVTDEAEEVMLVDMEGHDTVGGDSESTGLLVDISEGTTSPPVTLSPTPHVANIISLDEEVWSGNHDDDAALMKPISDSSLEMKKETKPVRPAPPKPSARRSKSMRDGKPVPPAKPLLRKGTTGNLKTSPPSGDNERTPMIIISSQKAKTTQRAVSPPSTSKKKYSMLSGSDSPNESHDKSHDSNEDEKDGDGSKFKWRGFKGQLKGADSPIMEDREKGHSRSTSLDLNKMLLGEGNTEVLEDMPSATPPKPPPKPHLPAHHPLVVSPSKPVVAPRPRARAASTGSITSPLEVTSGDEQAVLDTSADALLLSHHDPPLTKVKPTRKAPRRPPPPKAKPEGLDGRDKKDVQATIRSLKENNGLLTEVNRSLEEKLLQLQEERIKLARELELAELKYH